MLDTYRINRESGDALAIESSAIGAAVRSLMSQKAWEGNAQELLDALKGHTEEDDRKDRCWPRSAKTLANEIRRITPDLRGEAIEVQFLPRQGESRRRLIHLERTRN